MSSRDNNISKVLVVGSDTAFATSGTATVSDLALGGIGVFDAKTNKAITLTGGANAYAGQDFYLAVAVDTTGNGVVDDFVKVAGDKIQAKNLLAYTKKAGVAGVPQIVEVDGYAGASNTVYTMNIVFDGSEIENLQGYNQFTKIFSIKTPLGAIGADANQVTKLMYDALIANASDFLTVKIVTNDDLTILTHGVAADYTAGDEILYADLDAIIAYNIANTATLSSKLEITSISSSPSVVDGINLDYLTKLEVGITVSLSDGFNGIGTVTTTQDKVLGQGQGTKVRYMESYTVGESPSGVYRVSSLNGTSKNLDGYIHAVPGTLYDLYVLEYNIKADAGWKEYENGMNTVIAIPESYSTNNFEAILEDIVVDGLGITLE